MKFTHLFAPTLRQDPADADLISHRLLLRGGYIRRVTSGVYDLLPLGLRVLRNIEAIIREEMNAAGGQELLMPMTQPAELWQQSGRWEKYGKELLRFTDRHQHDSCLGPTHEEVICHLVAGDLRSWRQLPMNLYQIQAKFRDEIRPRFGLMRGREFTMKDAYSFHADEEDLAREYDNMFVTYQRIFSRFGLTFRPVEADTGSIGGNRSHEFHVLAESGEDLIAYCTECDYAANVEKAESKRSTALFDGDAQPCEEVTTPGLTEVDEVADLLKATADQLLKTLIYQVEGGDLDGQTIAVCLAGDDQLQEIKLQRAIAADALTMASAAEIAEVGGVVGFIGPQELTCPIYADLALKQASDLIAGGNRADTHLRHLSLPRDVTTAQFVDLRQARADDLCPHCQGAIALARGIEVGQLFALGKQYTQPMGVEFQDRNGRRAIPTMGCYGIGVSRLVAAIVEQCHDEAGICWPKAVAPFQVVLITLGNKEPAAQASATIYAQLGAAAIDTLWDDRKERPGVKFKDAELMGIPLQIMVGERGLAQGVVEIKPRQGEKQMVPLNELLTTISQQLSE